MKIRMIEAGYKGFTGMFGTVEFKDGVSVNDVSDADARFFASIIGIENVEDGKDPGSNAQFQNSLTLSAVSVTLPTRAQTAKRDEKVEEKPKVDEPIAGTYTKAQLEEIADKGGIAGLREIADPLGVKGTSIAKLIDAILMKQVGQAPEAAPLAEGQPDVVTAEGTEGQPVVVETEE